MGNLFNKNILEIIDLIYLFNEHELFYVWALFAVYLLKQKNTGTVSLIYTLQYLFISCYRTSSSHRAGVLFDMNAHVGLETVPECRME